MEKMLDGKVAIITGSGRGIGKAAAMLFAAEGAKVVVSDIDPAPAEETVAEIKAAGGEAIAYAGDATADDFAEGIVKAAVDAWGGLHIIVNNAGYTWDGVVHKMTDKQWDAMMAIHLRTPFRLIRAAAPYFKDAAKKEMAEGGPVARKIINISSVSGTRGNAGQINYSSAKSGLLGMTKTMAQEWGRYNVQSNAVAYGWVETRLTAAKEDAGAVDRDGEKVALGIPDAQRQMMKMVIPMGRGGTPEEAAGVILFLASPLSNYVSGQCIEMTGGM
ncbi:MULTISPECIES: SDR family NAD(P)-dependent oxidoreductase [Desulfatibacillum]|jgi:3-oxoacyl-[acyl-carrier protein] reductase|uniref:3-Oxoacyl (Acyl-carrier protein) reductase n=2 Tax=Desulfatibacillum TaxID=218207 RepID=B8FJC9_DESAL|nr:MULTISPECIES: SDR family oxidoreductase [Desulfatibacillum]ACL05598.1 3-Oxoacyl (acyl-carrier protein) reductase [Desulfatibacillum aliphaticivorans]SHI93083.1 3-oxoacyl-[acyl-carrier protein] reductase [Desulfatibacillum alkenivorans DSM 16219]